MISSISCLYLLPVYLLLLFEESFPCPDGCIVYCFLRKLQLRLSNHHLSSRNRFLIDRGCLLIFSISLSRPSFSQSNVSQTPILSILLVPESGAFNIHTLCTLFADHLVHRPDIYYFMSPQNSKTPSAYSQKAPSDDNGF